MPHLASRYSVSMYKWFDAARQSSVVRTLSVCCKLYILFDCTVLWCQTYEKMAKNCFLYSTVSRSLQSLRLDTFPIRWHIKDFSNIGKHSIELLLELEQMVLHLMIQWCSRGSDTVSRISTKRLLILRLCRGIAKLSSLFWSYHYYENIWIYIYIYITISL